MKYEHTGMLDELNDQSRAQRDAIIAEIHAAFSNVTRGENGISWAECVAIDNWESEEVCAAARRSETDSHWSELVDQPDWQPFPGIGGFNFINAEGFQYYLPPTIIRFLRGDISEWFPGHLLEFINRFTAPRLIVRWSESQLRAISRFIAFMACHDKDELVESENAWADAMKQRWHAYLPTSGM